MTNQLKQVASCLLGALVTIGLTQDANAVTFSEGTGNQAVAFGNLGLNGGTGIPDRILDASFPLTPTNFTNQSPVTNVRTFEQLKLDGEIPNDAILKSVEVFLFGELNTPQLFHGNMGNAPTDLLSFEIGAQLTLDLNKAEVVIASPTMDALAEISLNGQLPNPIPSNTTPTMTPIASLTASDVVSASITDLSPFLVPGTVDFYLDGTNTTLVQTTGGMGFASAMVEGYGEYALEYDYEVAPVPFETESGMALVAIAGLMAYRQLRQRHKHHMNN